ncbi:hypothetical protein BO78DRAFT_55868 [Aspergillus sclerotiicarbonarius CBS 121057]|uniref:Zn(2)-C6 fungal-type domain-containing protein n=1 Tax=Aspergillus sclerotiicarbonarius (strain CBS 121057 / IBT 28362) TaxID=1448318 RepID=A0A319EES4_ASPSB|nr:hypothetical protein BO78DRAFT_55868 [Aspergillus sclerotiicarbonarius CBS 121057]
MAARLEPRLARSCDHCKAKKTRCLQPKHRMSLQSHAETVETERKARLTRVMYYTPPISGGHSLTSSQ